MLAIVLEDLPLMIPLAFLYHNFEIFSVEVCNKTFLYPCNIYIYIYIEMHRLDPSKTNQLFLLYCIQLNFQNMTTCILTSNLIKTLKESEFHIDTDKWHD